MEKQILPNLDLFSNEFLPAVWPGDCIGCSHTNPIGFHLHFWFQDGITWSKTTISSHFCGFNNIAHGGTVAMLLDEIGAYSLYIQCLNLAVTSNASISYYRPVPINQDILLAGKVVDPDPARPRSEAGIYNLKGQLLAECKSEWRFTSVEQLAKISGLDSQLINTMMKQYLDPIHAYLKNLQIRP